MKNKDVLFVLGTRPELIKFVPLITKFRADKTYRTRVCLTGQHKELLLDLIDFFNFQFENDLAIMKNNQSLTSTFIDILSGLNNLYSNDLPSVVFVQGDTNSAFAGALFGYYNQIQVAHIEAGLRSENVWSPFPEEGNRKMIGQISSFHFAATKESVNNLYNERIFDGVYLVGNTVIDSLLFTINKVNKNSKPYFQHFKELDISLEKKIILCTLHRRENFGKPLENICRALKIVAYSYPDIQIVIPVHPNRNGQVLREKLENIENIKLIPPQTYDSFVFLMQESHILLTDSGGIQEEAITINKPILVLRENTERPEVIEVGAAKLVHDNVHLITQTIEKLLINDGLYKSMTGKLNPFGDGEASSRMKEIIDDFFLQSEYKMEIQETTFQQK